MKRWKRVGVVAVAGGAVALALATFPRPQHAHSASPTAVRTGVTAAAKAGKPEEPVAPRAAAVPVIKSTPPLAGASRAGSKTLAPSPAISTSAAPVDPPQTSPVASPLTAPVPIAVPDPASATIATTPPPAQPTLSAPPKPGPVTVVIKKDSVIGIRIDQAITTGSAHVDDRISGRVSRDVIVDGTIAIPAGTRVEGSVTAVERPTSANPRGKLGIRFTSIVRPDNTRVAISTETINREASDPAAPNGGSFDVNAFSALVSGSGRTAPGRSAKESPAPKASQPREALLPAGAPLTLHLISPLSLTINRDPE